MRSTITSAAILTLGFALLTSCSSAPKTAGESVALENEVQATIARFKAEDPGISRFFDTARGYVVFPTVGKGGLIVGGAHGDGAVYEGGELIGYCGLSQATIGAQIGGQSYAEIIFFESADPLNDLKRDQFEFAAQASAVVITSGASADAKYDHGVAVFTMPLGGAMLEASVGGQKFDFTSKSVIDSE